MKSFEEISIIIADDDLITRQKLKMQLREKGFISIAEASHGERVFLLLKEREVDILFLDIEMPKVNGLDVLKEIRIKYPNMAIIMISASATLDNVTLSLNLGVDGFVVKPFDSEKIYTAIDNGLKKRALAF